MKHLQTKKGITLFFAILIIALMLGIGASISLLAQKQLRYSSVGSQSELSFYAANAGIECAEYWDRNITPNPFGLPIAPDNRNSASVIQCDGSQYQVPVGYTMVVENHNNPYNDNYIRFSNNSCAIVTVTKYQDNGVWITDIVSQGYNTCAAGASNRLERAIHVTY